ncbi:MAG: hypothetical protein OXI81_20420 [Paracoccaceae bacterium]|nr:hypothetical protein [Paracoccaceae bacterium]MDE2912131.1 hypothetical protein [Paracoccaceae bacterium]
MTAGMISLARADNYDIAALVSSNRDFVPVSVSLVTMGIKVIRGAFPPTGSRIAGCC